MKTILIASLLFLLTGCGSIKDPFSSSGAYSGIAPPKIHVNDSDQTRYDPLKQEKNNITSAEIAPYDEYYAALKSAKNSNSPLTNDISTDYLKKGIAVVNVSCLRWFQSLAEAEIHFNFAQNNQNVIQNLGTTLLGIGKANPIIVGSYGAGFTALNGVESSFSQAFFLAPNSNKVKSHIFSSLDAQAQTILKNPPSTFSEAYVALERYADICTQQTAKEIINSALDQTQTSIDQTQGGKVNTTATPEAKELAVNEATKDLKSKVSTLTQAVTEKNASNESLQKKNQDLQKANADLANHANLDAQILTLQKENDDLMKQVSQLKLAIQKQQQGPPQGQ